MESILIETLKREKPYLENTFQVFRIGVFGSFARGEESQASDIDILVEFKELPDLFSYIDIEIYLEKKLNRKVDLVEKNSIRAELKDRILSEVRYI